MFEKSIGVSTPISRTPSGSTTKVNSWRSQTIILLNLLFVIVILSGYAAAQTITFETPTYTLGNINGQNGWSKTGPFDHAVSSSNGTAGFGAQSFRVSNAITSGTFGD